MRSRSNQETRSTSQRYIPSAAQKTCLVGSIVCLERSTELHENKSKLSICGSSVWAGVLLWAPQASEPLSYEDHFHLINLISRRRMRHRSYTYVMGLVRARRQHRAWAIATWSVGIVCHFLHQVIRPRYCSSEQRHSRLEGTIFGCYDDHDEKESDRVMWHRVHKCTSLRHSTSKLSSIHPLQDQNSSIFRNGTQHTCKAMPSRRASDQHSPRSTSSYAIRCSTLRRLRRVRRRRSLRLQNPAPGS